MKYLSIILLLLSTPVLADHGHYWPESSVDYKPEDVSAEVDCLAKNIYFEARNESIQGQIAVGLVTINRVRSDRYPNTICEVVWERRTDARSGKTVAQFSWTLDGLSDNPKNVKAWEDSYRLADAMIAEGQLTNFHDFTHGANHYHAHYVNPDWSAHLELKLEIDNHIFYRF
jgi:spore germination cell wall hydrolase CwlJ-like protein